MNNKLVNISAFQELCVPEAALMNCVPKEVRCLPPSCFHAYCLCHCVRQPLSSWPFSTVAVARLSLRPYEDGLNSALTCV